MTAPKRDKQVKRVEGGKPAGFLKPRTSPVSNKVLLILAVCVILLLIGWKFFFNGAKSTAVDIDPAKFEELSKQPEAFVLDVRSGFEFGGDKIAGAKNISFTSKDFKQEAEKLDKDKTYLIYCATGSRSAGAVSVLKALGFTKIYNLKGGIDNWKDAGKPVVR
ncbi:MAG: rhodanese-like domain-containing protein [Ignavibacteria bacterium]|nr:rhodanese-like domain-containing protein [Ignavibacteria bacterium]